MDSHRRVAEHQKKQPANTWPMSSASKFLYGRHQTKPMPMLQQETGGIAILVILFVSTDGIALTAVLGKVTNTIAVAHPQGLTIWTTCHILLENASAIVYSG